MLYQELLGELKSCAEKSYADFNKKLLKKDKINVLGVRIPTLRKIAKKYRSTIEDIVRLNEIENPDKIDVGMQLFIPKYVCAKSN